MDFLLSNTCRGNYGIPPLLKMPGQFWNNSNPKKAGAILELPIALFVRGVLHPPLTYRNLSPFFRNLAL